MCEDHRANASIDLEHDTADLGRKIACPMMVLWGEKGGLPGFDVVAEWPERAQNVRGKALPGTHWLPGQLPAETRAELVAFSLLEDDETGRCRFRMTAPHGRPGGLGVR